MKTLQDKIRGSLIGGAVGDALGYPVEFMSQLNESMVRRASADIKPLIVMGKQLSLTILR